MRTIILGCYIILFSICLLGCQKTDENYVRDYVGDYYFEIKHHRWSIDNGENDTIYYHHGTINEIGNKEIMIEYNSPSFYPAYCNIQVEVDKSGNLGSPEYSFQNPNDIFYGKFLNVDTVEFTLKPQGGGLGGGGSFEVIGIR